MRAWAGDIDEFWDCAVDVVATGDCVKARKVTDAIHESYYTVLDFGC